MDSLWDKPKKQYWELNQFQKDYIERQSKKGKAYQAAIRRNKRIESRKKSDARKLKTLEKAKKLADGTYYHDSVSVIHWVKDTPHSLALQFCEWRAKNAKQRRLRRTRSA